MGVTKSELFNLQQNELAALAKVLGHPARVAILEHISSSNSCITGDLVSELGLAQATISQHLKELKAIGVIKGSIEGTSVCYCIDENRWNEMKQLFVQFFNKSPNSDQCC